MSVPVAEIFLSRQGEGANTGREMVFLRLAGCNLSCPWCDTDIQTVEQLSIEETIDRASAIAPCRNLLVTGGEPTIQPALPELLSRFKKRGWWIAMESNGVFRPTNRERENIDWLSISPKAFCPEKYIPERMAREADEVRIVADSPDVSAFCDKMRFLIAAKYYFVSPCERSGRFNWWQTAELLGKLNEANPSPPWLLSVQTHKLAGER